MSAWRAALFAAMTAVEASEQACWGLPAAGTITFDMQVPLGDAGVKKP
jgi:hypothetical protein